MSLPNGTWQPQGGGYPAPSQPPYGAPGSPQPIPGNYQHSSFGGGFPSGPMPGPGPRPGPPAGWQAPTRSIYGPSPYPPQYVRARQAGRGVVIGCLVAVSVVVGISVAAFVVLGVILGRTSTPTGAASTELWTPAPTTQTTPKSTPKAEPTPQPSAKPTTKATPKPTPPPAQKPFTLPPRDFGALPPPHSTHPAWKTVQRAALYKAKFPNLTGCPKPDYIEDMAKLKTYTTQQLACIQKAWQPVLKSLGLPSKNIPHFYYSGSTGTSSCGTITAPAFYCSANGGTISFGSDLLKGTTYDVIWAKDLTGHEYGHHLQALSGFFDAMYELPQDNEILRRSEIQATCIGMGMLRRDNSYTLNSEFFSGLEPHLQSFLDDGVHGSKKSLSYWGMRGFYASVVGDCNTWTVGAGWVE